MRHMTPEIVAALEEERRYQEEKWGTRSGSHDLASWIAFIEMHIMQVKISIYDGQDDILGHEIRKIAALAIAAMEDHGVATRSEEVDG